MVCECPAWPQRGGGFGASKLGGRWVALGWLLRPRLVQFQPQCNFGFVLSELALLALTFLPFLAFSFSFSICCLGSCEGVEGVPSPGLVLVLAIIFSFGLSFL